MLALLFALDIFAFRLGEPLPPTQPRVEWNVEAIAGLFETQNLVLKVDEAGKLRAVHVQIVPDSGATATDVLRLADDVRAHLTRRFGTPTWDRREGRATSDILAIMNGEVARTTQWETATRTIRTGIPRRLDGRVVVEIAITDRPLSRTNPFWSAE